MYDVTNTFFSQGTNGSINKWPFNYQPNIDMSPLAIPVFGTNVDFYYTSDNGANGASQGTNDQLLVLTIANPAYQVLLHSNHNYVVELSTDPIGQNANNVGLFQWVRDTGGTFQQELFPDLGDGNQTEGWRNKRSFDKYGLLYPPARAQPGDHRTGTPGGERGFRYE